MKSFYFFLMLAIAQPVFAQQANQKPPEVQVEEMRARERREQEMRDWETKIFPIKYADPNQLWAALRMFRAEINPENNLRILAVKAPKEIMPAIADAIKTLDVPTRAKRVDLTVFILLATDQPDPAKTVPAVLQPVINQLKGVLAYKGYELVDTLIAPGTDDRMTEHNGALSPLDRASQMPSRYFFRAMFRVDATEGRGPVLRLDNMQFSLDVFHAPNAPASNVRIQTHIDIPAGQQVVVGKGTLGDKAIILVMNAKFLD